ncbi:MAG TPA: DNA polymerase/3'-5' exonuclease PolX [Acidobacteriota bacterium]|nr:DNA polymerase/3'-5' exonuclease PolX [Acidobacteriota bacterium]
MTNQDIASVFDEIADILEIKGDNPFRVRSYRRAAETISALPFDIESVIDTDPDRIRSAPGIGVGTFRKIQELIETGSCQEHENLRREFPPSLLELLRVQDLGPKKIALFYKHLGIRNLDELEAAARQEKLRELPGMGAKSELKILKSIEELRHRQGRFRLDYGTEISNRILDYLRSQANVQRIAAAGSVRRRKETIGDVDVLVTTSNPGDVIRTFTTFPGTYEVQAQGETKASIRTRQGLQVDLRVVEDDAFGACLQYFTGSKEHNVALRERAKRMGFKISEYGLFDTESGDRVAGREECEIYEKLRLPWIPPELRENRGEIEKAEKGELPALVTIDNIRGDLHMHTTASDGRNTIEEMAAAGLERGYAFIGITDHSKSLAMVRGLDEEKLLRQMEEIEAYRRTNSGIEVLKGIEVDILADGSLDLDTSVLSQLDFVIASIHSRFNMTRDEMTRRICRALENPTVSILAHPTGRLLLQRDAYQVDLEEIIKAAVANRVCLEINAYPARLDLSDIHCRMARDMGALITINSDSHTDGMLHYMSFGVDTARRGWLEAEDVINTYPVDRLKRVLKKQEYR